eukprot:TRINITY_DN61108_c0_g1_i1.p1 TRINITY_DN61108_c0_g1~~TRINITY_DN61108_c0_g1_i1.p1  ORF type:complete len:169 (+),score=32.66 TRINITY_DN61108_c0_g1_i1:156-662(+)
MLRSLVGSEMCIRDRYQRRVRGSRNPTMSLPRAGCSLAGLSRNLRRFELERNPLWWTPGVDQLCASDVEPLELRHLLALEQGADRAFAELSLGYPDSQGSLGLREAVAQLYGPGVTPGQVTVCAPQEGILLTMHAMLDPTDTIVVVAPAYQSLYEVARAIGCTIRRCC